MKKIYEIHNGENVLTVDCEKEKVYFNGNEVLKISMNYDGGVLTIFCGKAHYFNSGMKAE